MSFDERSWAFAFEYAMEVVSREGVQMRASKELTVPEKKLLDGQIGRIIVSMITASHARPTEEVYNEYKMDWEY